MPQDLPQETHIAHGINCSSVVMNLLIEKIEAFAEALTAFWREAAHPAGNGPGIVEVAK